MSTRQLFVSLAALTVTGFLSACVAGDCRNHFTPGQIAYMAKTTIALKPEFLVDAVPAP